MFDKDTIAVNFKTISSKKENKIAILFDIKPQQKYRVLALPEAFTDIFASAVQSRLRLNGDPAAIISGGMDSGGISAMMGRLRNELPKGRYHTYSLILDDPASSLESCCIQEMTQGAGIDAHYSYLPSFKGILSMEDLFDVAWKNAHPVDNGIIVVSAMCFAAGRNGHPVLFHGVVQ